MDKYQDKDPDQVLAIVEKFRLGLVNIEDRALNRVPEKVIDAEYTQVKAIEAEKPLDPAQRMAYLKAKYKGKWKVGPKKCIEEDKIFCAICRESFKTLTSKHLAQHDGMTSDEYKELCGYSKDTPLMATKVLEDFRERMKKGGTTYESRQKTVAAKKASKAEETT